MQIQVGRKNAASAIHYLYKEDEIWYRNLDDVTKEIAEIENAMDAGAVSYTLQYSVKCKQNLLRTIED